MTLLGSSHLTNNVAMGASFPQARHLRSGPHLSNASAGFCNDLKQQRLETYRNVENPIQWEDNSASKSLSRPLPPGVPEHRNLVPPHEGSRASL